MTPKNNAQEPITSRQRLIEATKELLAQYSPSSITGKHIAAKSGIQYGLIYHYFESKEALFVTAMEELTSSYIRSREQFVDRSERLPTMGISGHETWWRAAANFSADGGHYAHSSRGWSHPVMNYELQAIRIAHPDVTEWEAKTHITHQICLNFGWVLFKQTVQNGFDLSEAQVKSLEQEVIGSY